MIILSDKGTAFNAIKSPVYPDIIYELYNLSK